MIQAQSESAANCSIAGSLNKSFNKQFGSLILSEILRTSEQTSEQTSRQLEDLQDLLLQFSSKEPRDSTSFC